jgi:superfamily II RNA helicase
VRLSVGGHLQHQPTLLTSSWHRKRPLALWISQKMKIFEIVPKKIKIV